MQRHKPRPCFYLAALAVMVALSGCSSQALRWTGENVARGTLDSLLGFPVFTVFTGAGDALSAGSEREHEQNVEALSDAYADFLDDEADAANEQACCLETFHR
jgi:hypothetical protein